MRIPSGKTDQYICASCKVSKPCGAFGLDRYQAHGRKHSCKECINAKRRGKYQDENRASHLKHTYGLTLDQYNGLVASQRGLCAICVEPGAQRSGGGRAKPSARLYVDHDAVTGKVRGLLCHRCNVAIGLLYDDPDRIERAAAYVRGMPGELLIASELHRSQNSDARRLQ